MITPRIICKTCGETYTQEVFPGSYNTDQFYGCAADVYLSEGKHYIQGYYGSRVADMKKYELNASPDRYELGPICDECITKLVNEKIAEEKEVDRDFW
jgi:hypothetical protein